MVMPAHQAFSRVGRWCAASAGTPLPGAARRSLSQQPGEGRGRFARQFGAGSARCARGSLPHRCHSEARPHDSTSARLFAAPKNLIADATWPRRGSSTTAGARCQRCASGAWLRAPTIDPSACRAPRTPNAWRGRPQDDVVGWGAAGQWSATRHQSIGAVREGGLRAVPAAGFQPAAFQPAVFHPDETRPPVFQPGDREGPCARS
jgi:hypothetical protein